MDLQDLAMKPETEPNWFLENLPERCHSAPFACHSALKNTPIFRHATQTPASLGVIFILRGVAKATWQTERSEESRYLQSQANTEILRRPAGQDSSG